MPNEKQSERPSIRLMHDRYEYWKNIPYPGLVIDNKPAMTQIDVTRVGDYFIYMSGDPLCAYSEDPVDLLAGRLEDPEVIGQNLFYKTVTGYWQGAKVTVCRGGPGGLLVALALHDVMEYTACSTFLRVGSAGGIDENAKIGDCIIASGIYRDDGTSRGFVPDGFPASCNYELTAALVEAANEQDIAYKLGVTACMDCDYTDNGRPSIGGYMQQAHIEKLGIYNRASVLCADCDAAAMMTLCNLFGRRGGAIFHITDNVCTGDPFVTGAGMKESLELALGGIAALHRMDEEKRRAGKAIWYPALRK